MLAIIGILLVTGTVFGGYLLEGGHIGVLIQPIEFLIIGGAAAGSLLISCPMSVLKSMGSQLGGVFTKAGGPTTTEYVDLLMLLFNIFKLAKANPLGLEPHIESPDKSDIFTKFPTVLHNHHAVHFICDTLRIQVSSAMSPYDLEELMDTDINTTHAEEHLAPSALTKVGDAMPGLGIVAAVLGVVITMGKLTQGKEVIGHSVAAALVGTFLGILASYGFLQPLAAKMESNNANEGQFLQVIKIALLAYAKDCGPKVCVEFARRTIPPTLRPSFEEVDKALSNNGKK
jgi:chemotaxis protein MotA